MNIDIKSIRHRAALQVAYNWRIRHRLPLITKLANELGLLDIGKEELLAQNTQSFKYLSIESN